MQNRKLQIKKPDLQKLISGEKTLEFYVQIDMLRLQSNVESLEVRRHFKDAYITIALEVLAAQPCNRKDHTTLQKTKDHLEERLELRKVQEDEVPRRMRIHGHWKWHPNFSVLPVSVIRRRFW